MSNDTFYQDIDLRHDTHADITFTGWAPKTDRRREASISTEYSDDLGLVLAYDTDTISEQLGRSAAYVFWQQMKHASPSGRLMYELGTHPFSPVILETDNF